MKLSDYIPMDKLAEHIAQGYVNINQHKEFPLDIYTYSKTCTFDYMWDDVTCNGAVNKAKLEMTEAQFIALCKAVAEKHGG